MSDSTKEAILSGKTMPLPTTIYLRDYQVPPYLVDEISLEIELTEEYATITSTMLIRHNRLSHDTGRTLQLNGEELTLLSIYLDKKPLDQSQYSVINQLLTIKSVPDHCELQIKTQIHPQKNTALSGLYRSANTFCTQCEAEGFRRITYFPDHPDILSRYTTTIIADATRYPYLLSNGNLINSGILPDGKHFATWEDPFKKPCYLFALVAGHFDVIEDQFITQSGREITLRIFVEPGYADQTSHAMFSLKEAMRWDEKTYGREYDLDIYMIVAISDFNMGAMENKGLNIFNTKYILAKPETATDDDYIHILSVIGHEYFHNWSGNRITCRDWFQLSLKEGLTIFRDQTFSEDTLSRAVMRIREVDSLRETQFPEDAGPLAHPVRPDSYIEINNFYTATIYNKGSEVLRMLQTIIEPNIFRKGMDLYFARYDGQAVTIEDFVRVMEDVSGADLTQFRYWYSQAGTPVVTISDQYDEKTQQYTLTLHQTCPPTPGQPDKKPLHIPIRTGLIDREGKEIGTETTLNLTQTKQTFSFDHIPSKPIPSLLRHFSAPVILQYPYSDSDLAHLVKHDTDAFNRWEAGQKYALNAILTLVQDYQQGKPLHLSTGLTDIITFSLQHEVDKFLLSEMLMLPSEKYVSEQMAVIDVDAIHAVREFVLQEIATTLQSLFLEIYKNNHSNEPYRFTMEAVSKRQLSNACLSYLLLLPQYAELGIKQFEASLKQNMTNTIPAFIGLSNMDSPNRKKALQAFYLAWKEDALVMDKWFAIQAASKLPSTVAEVKKLLHHPAFDIKNPNKVYALIGTFGHRNHHAFHDKSGAGYTFLQEVVQILDGLNPQVAARMVKPLTEWKRYDKERQTLMRSHLTALSQGKTLSPDLYELITKSLE